MPIEETPMDAENAAGGSMIYDNSTSAGFGDDQGAAQSYSGFANEVEEPPPGFEESFVRSNNGAGLEENHTSTDAQYPTTNGDGAVGTFEDAAPEKVVEEEVDGW